MHAPALPRLRRAADGVGWLALLVVLGAGCFLRFQLWATGRSFWLDELFVALNLREHSFAGLTGVLDYQQVAPLGWLWAEKAMLLRFGAAEQTLRLLPVVFGCLTVVIVAVLARQLFRWPAAVALTLLVAFSPSLIHYSAQLKQYSADSFFTVLLVVTGLWLVRSDYRVRALLCWGAAAALVPWGSQAAIFAAAGVSVVLLVTALRWRRWRTAVAFCLASLPLLGSVAAVYVLQLRAASHNQFLTDYWRHLLPQSFPPEPLTVDGLAKWAGQTALALMAQPGDAAVAWLAVALAVIGAVRLWRWDALAAQLLLAPLLVGYVLAALGRYPLAVRAAIWALPLVLALACAAADRLPGPRRLGIAPVPAVAVLLAFLLTFWSYLAGPDESTPIRYGRTQQALAYVADHQRPGDRVLVEWFTTPAALWYAPQVGLQWAGNYRYLPADQPCRAPQLEQRVAGADRLWIVYSIGARGTESVRHRLEQLGRQVDLWRAHHVYVIAYDLTRPRGGRDEGPCIVVGGKHFRQELPAAAQ